MNCGLQIPEKIEGSKVIEALKKRVGDNDTKFYMYYSSVISGEDFTDEFKEYFSKSRYKDKSLDFDGTNAKSIVNAIINYYNRTTPDGNDTVLQEKNTDESDAARNYTSVSDRNFCKRIVANTMLETYKNQYFERHSFVTIPKSELESKVLASFVNALRNRIQELENLSDDDLKDVKAKALAAAGINPNTVGNKYITEYKQSVSDTKKLLNALVYVTTAKHIFGKNMDSQTQNLVATVEELINFNVEPKSGKTVRDLFLDSIYKDSRLEVVRNGIDNDTHTAAEEKAQDNEDVAFGEDVEELDDTTNKEYDLSFRAFDGHDGRYKTFMMHVSGNILVYLNSLKKLNGTGLVNGKRYYNVDNPIGLADTMSAKQCASILYTSVNYFSINSMIKSIRDIADRIPGYEAFTQLADDLTSNPDFAYEFYDTFAKFAVSKLATVITGDERNTRITNRSSNRRQAFGFQCINDAKSTFISANDAVVDKLFDKIESIKSTANKGAVWKSKITPLDTQAKRKELIDTIGTLVQYYFPNIDKSAVLNYITQNKKAVKQTQTNSGDTIQGVDEEYNINQLVVSLKAIRTAANTAKEEYNSRIDASARLAKENKDTKSLWEKSYIDNDAQGAIFDLSDKLVKYSVVKTELNSPNVHGKQSSDVINNSMISNLMKILNSDDSVKDTDSTLTRYAEYKFRGHQYDLSNILIEHKDEKGDIINYGLFEKRPDGYYPTSYAKELIDMKLFDGVTDINSDKSLTYPEMSRGDYLATAIINFKKSTGASVANPNIKFADYFLRTPSDAPKNYIMTAPMYKIAKEAWIFDDAKGVRDTIQAQIAAIPYIDYADERANILAGYVEVDSNTLLSIIEGNNEELNRVSNKDLKPASNNDLTQVYVTVKSGENEVLLKGTRESTTTKTTDVYDLEVVGVVGAFTSDVLKSLRNYYERQIINGNLLVNGQIAKRHLDRNHPIYKQMYAAFMQELIDMGVAIDTIFEHENGRIKTEKGKPVFKPAYANGEIKNLYDNYHHKKGTIVEEDAPNHYRLVGNVFTSDKFTIIDKETGDKINYLEKVFSESLPAINEATGEVVEAGNINILYGATSNDYLHINDDGSITLTDAQQARVEAALDNFISDYVDSTQESLKDYDNMLVGVDHSKEDIAEFILNYRVAYFNSNDLFEGNAKFYKDSQDFLKRAKEVQGSGVSYAIASYEKPMFGQYKQKVEGAFINSDSERGLLDKLNDCYQYTTFTGVTIENTLKVSDESEQELEKQLTDNFIKEGFKENVAKQKAKEITSRYKNTKVNDAQSYITFEEWIKRIAARGQYHKYKPLIEAILDESKPIDSKTISEFIQVQKNFYYDMYYNEQSNVMVPRQIKNAEFVLVPRFIKNTELEQVYNLMIENNIDQLNTVETSKAGKTNILKLWDSNGTLTQANINKFKKEVAGALEIFDYNYLYTQQETPQHVNARNKAGIQLMKKIIDNIDETSELYKVKQDLIANYTTNIHDSFVELATSLGVTLVDGHLELDDNKNIKNMSYEQVYQRLEEEMLRLGLDSNMLDYCTLEPDEMEKEPNETGTGARPRMSSHFSNVKTKLENIAQAIVNQQVTKQMLPGFHAAQVTQVGLKRFLDDNGKKIADSNAIRKSDKLRYHPDGKRYIEVMVTAEALGIDRNSPAYAGKSNKEILDELRAKGLDEFIGYRIPTEGKQSVAIMKVVDLLDDSQGSTIVVPDMWVAQTGSDFDIDSIYGIQKSSYLDNDGIIHPVTYKDDNEKDYYSYIFSTLPVEERNEIIRNTRVTSGDRRAIAEENPNLDIISLMNAIDAERKENLKARLKYAAREYGLMTVEQYKKNLPAANSRAARNTRIVQDMIDILKSDESLEENLSSSNYKDIINARDALLKGSAIGKARKNRSAYDFIDQANYQEDAMSGARLKGASVSRDNLCSVCNTAKPTLVSPIYITYKLKKGQTVEDLRKSFDIVTSPSVGYVTVRHNTFGWSKNNRNVAGKLITVYSSETTAHILDAIKEGNVPNVNSFTFNVYKTFPDIGSDYETAIAFMMQPGVTEIVDAYNRTKSVYVNEYESPINLAYESIAKKLGVKGTDIKKQISKRIAKDTTYTSQNVLNATLLKQRLNGELSETHALYFDFEVINKYEELSKIASQIDAIGRVLNPDKFGAKQSIFATEKVFDDIAKIIASDDQVFNKVTVNDTRKHFLEAIYPNITGGIDAYIEAPDTIPSIYPTAHYFLKYASATSVKLNSQLFATKTRGFKMTVNYIRNILAGLNPEVDEQLYNDAERYILTSLYNEVRIISKPVTYSNGRIMEVDTLNQLNTDAIRRNETRRIYGYGYNASVPEFSPKDINNPTQNEIDEFALFTPAQKVLWIQGHFRDSLIGKYLQAKLANDGSVRKNVANSQTIEFVEDGQDMDEVYEEFRKTYQNKNPFLVLTAMDIIKYGFVAEGFKMRKGSVNRVIDNDILINDLGPQGTGIKRAVDNIMTKMSDLTTPEDLYRTTGIDIDDVIERYARINPHTKGLAQTYLSKREVRKIAKFRRNDGLIALPNTNVFTDFIKQHNIGTYVDGVDEYGNEIQEFVPNLYINIKERITYEDGKSDVIERLYKTQVGENSKTIYLYPLSKLSQNEVSDISVNDFNNFGVQYSKEYFEQIIDSIEGTCPNYNIDEGITTFKETKLDDAADYKLTQGKVEKKKPIPLNINDKSKGAIMQLKADIIEHFKDNHSNLYTENIELRNHLFVPNPKEGIELTLDDGRKFWAYKLNTAPLYFYTSHVDAAIPTIWADLADKIENARERGNYEGNAHLHNLFVITEKRPSDVRSSSVTERISKATLQGVRSARREARKEETEEGEKFTYRLNRNNIENTKESVEANLDEIVRDTAAYVTSKVDRLINAQKGLKYFTQDLETMEWISVADDRIKSRILDEPTLRRNFLKLLLDVYDTIDVYSKFASFNLDEESKNLKPFIEQIVEAVNKLQTEVDLEKAESIYVDVLASQSNNPNIRRNIISLYDNFHRTNTLTSHISDVQDIANPIVQLITKDVMADLRAKQFKAEQDVKEYRKFIEDLKEEAKSKGFSINWDKIIDKNGRFIAGYTENFLNDLEELIETKSKAREKYNLATSPVEEIAAFEDWYRANLAYRKFLVDNTHTRIKQEYAKEYIALEEKMLANHKDVFLEHAKLNDKLRDVLSHAVRGRLDEHWEAERKAINAKINALCSQVILNPDGSFEYKQELTEEELSKNPEERRIQIINSRVSASALTNYLADRKKLNEVVYSYDDKFGFDEELKKYESIINSREIRNAQGKLIVSEAQLANDKEYQAAKAWVRENSIFIYDLYKDENGIDVTLNEKEAKDVLSTYYDNPEAITYPYNIVVQAAMKYFSRGVGERGNKKAAYKLLAKREEARDKLGIIDGRKFTDEEINIIKKEQEARYNIGESSGYNESRIIHNAPEDDTVYTTAFYQGMKAEGITNPEYLAIVNGKKEGETKTLGINDYLVRALDSSTGRLHTSELSVEELNAVRDLFVKLGYDPIEQTFDAKEGVKKLKGVKRKDSEARKEFIEKYVDFVTDDDAFELEKEFAKRKGDRYYLAWCEVNQEWSDSKMMFVPNHLLWGYAKPKASLTKNELDKFIDKEKTSAIRILNNTFEEKITPYYFDKVKELVETYGVDSDEYRAWFDANHIYNPYTHKQEPIVIWKYSEPTDALPGHREANYSMRERSVKEEATDPEYVNKVGIAANYKKDSKYDAPNTLNEYERKLSDYLQALVFDYAKTKDAQLRARKGYAPAKAKKEDKSLTKIALTELIHSLGFIEGHNGKERYDDDVSYGTDYTPSMPLMSMLKDKTSVDIAKYEEEHAPIQRVGESDEEFNARRKAFEEDVEKQKEHNLEVHQAMLDRNWEDVFADYITKASHYNAIQDNKYQLYMGQRLINNMPAYKISDVTGKLIKSNGEYVTETDNNLQEVYTNWIRRLVFDQWKKPQGNLTRSMQILQSLTSTKYMTLNLRGGIANVLVGEFGILGEAFAREYFNAANWAQGKSDWALGVSDYMANCFADTPCNTLSGAIVKGFEIVDFDEYTGQVRKLDAEEVSKKFRDMGFMFLSTGEHFMQNGALFSMMRSHRVVENPRYGEPGQMQWAVMNKDEYLRYSEEEAFENIATEEEKAAFAKYKANIQGDANEAADYATFRKDLYSEFAFIHLSKERNKAYREELDKVKEQRKAKFETYSIVREQFKLGEDGKLAFADGSVFKSLDIVREGQEISDAYRLMGEFRGRVISVNKKIHGFYDKMGSALIEREWWGGIVMQYHKHIYPGIMKRYRRKGYFNEERGTIEKGTFWSLIDFLKMPIRKIAAEQRMNAAQTETMLGIQNYFKYATNYLQYLILAAHNLPDYEVANIMRGLQDLFGMTSAILAAIAVRMLGDDDDDSIIYNLALYEADRLATETGMYSLGAPTEFRTLWSSPTAAQSFFGDALNVLGTTAGILLEGDEYDPYYRSGRYAGRHKAEVYITRNIPYWRNIAAIRDIGDSNQYYRVGDDVMSFVPVKKWTDKWKHKK